MGAESKEGGAHMTRQELFDLCKGVYCSMPDYPFDDWNESAVFRHSDSRKWFALAMRIPRRKLGFDSDELVDVVNLKLPSEMLGSFGRGDGVYPAYHMNKLHWISVILPDAPDDVVKFLLNASFEATRTKKKGRTKKVLNITNGDAFNKYFLANHKENAVPFREVMMDGEAIQDVFSPKFIDLRAAAVGVSAEEYRANMLAYDALIKGSYDEIRLWFGKDTFCQMNLLTLLAFLEQIHYGGNVVLNYIDDESFAIIEPNIQVVLGKYQGLYESILIDRQMPKRLGVLNPRAVELFLDYHSDDGALAKLVRENTGMDDMGLMCLLLENSSEYGLSDIQAEKLIKKYRKV